MRGKAQLHDETDIELVLKAKVAGDERAFATLVKRHQARLRAFLMRLCGSDALTDDIAQDTLMKAHRNLKSFNGGGSFRSWLFSIAYREFLQTKRKERASERLESALADSIEEASPSAHATMSVDLQRALHSLSELERACVLLCDASGFSHAEASSALDTPLGSVKTYIARARQKLKAHLTQEASAPPNDLDREKNGVDYAH